jgi:predicted aspartyl protease
VEGSDVEMDDEMLLQLRGKMGFFDLKKVRTWLLFATFMSGSIGPPALADAVNIPMRGIDAGTYYVEVVVAGLGSVDFLVDTGSGYTAIDTGMLTEMQRTGDAVFVKKLEGIMADGSTMVVPVYQISEIRIGACVLRDVDAAVFGDGARPILGMRALSRVAPFTFSTNPPGISLSRCDAVIAVGASPELATPDQPVSQAVIGEAG